MSNVALYRKYRPHNFENLVGQEHVRTTLMNAIKSDRVAHAYLFTGPRGTGKTSTARLMAKALSCENLKNGCEPCDKCEFCLDINDGRLIDLIEIDAASNRGIDEVRDLNQKIKFAPSRGNCKIYIIDEVHMMTKEAFNALLKTLEEPPDHAYFILATTEVHKIPDTIISRCQRFDFKRLSEKTILTRLNYIAQVEKVDADEKALEVISHYVDGGLRDAIGLFEQMTIDGKIPFEQVHEVLGTSENSLLERLFDALMSKNLKEGIRIIHELHDQGSDMKQFAHEFIDNLRLKLLKAVNEGKLNHVASYMKVIEVFQEAEGKISIASIPQLPLEIAVIKVIGPKSEEVEVVKKIEVKVEKKVEVKKVEEPVKEVVKEVKVEKVEKEKTPEEEEASDAPGEAIDLSFDKMKEDWPRITERVKSPSLRMSLRSAKPAKLENRDLTLQFTANFHKEKVMEHDHRVELESVLKEHFGTGLKILASLKELEIKPVMQEETYEAQHKQEPPNEEPVVDTAVDAALDIFGGEVVG